MQGQYGARAEDRGEIAEGAVGVGRETSGGERVVPGCDEELAAVEHLGEIVVHQGASLGGPKPLALPGGHGFPEVTTGRVGVLPGGVVGCGSYRGPAGQDGKNLTIGRR